MVIIRRALQIIFGVLVVLVTLMMFSSDSANYVGSFILLGTFIFIIILLGPWWKSVVNFAQEKPDLSKDKSARGFAYLILFLMGILSFYKSWIIYKSAQYEYHRWEASLAFFFGKDGVALFWLFAGVVILAEIVRKLMRSNNNELNQ